MSNDTHTVPTLKELETRAQTIREYLDSAPIKTLNHHVVENCRKHGISLDSPWPPRYPEKGEPEPPKAEQKEQLILFPTFPTETRPVVNDIASSALFAAIQGKDRQWLRGETIAASGDTVMSFTGQQFNQDDHDVFMQLVSVASIRPAGEYVTATAHSLLKALGRGTGKSQHEQLKAEIKRLVEGTFHLKTSKVDYHGHLIDDAIQDKESRYWVFRVNPLIRQLFNQDSYTLIDWEQRKRLKGKDLARWLQLEIARHAKPFPVKVETLRRNSGSKAKALRHFREQLKATLDTLKALGEIKDWRIDPETDLVHIDRGDAISDSQRRYLAPHPPRPVEVAGSVKAGMGNKRCRHGSRPAQARQ